MTSREKEDINSSRIISEFFYHSSPSKLKGRKDDSYWKKNWDFSRQINDFNSKYRRTSEDLEIALKFQEMKSSKKILAIHDIGACLNKLTEKESEFYLNLLLEHWSCWPAHRTEIGFFCQNVCFEFLSGIRPRWLDLEEEHFKNMISRHLSALGHSWENSSSERRYRMFDSSFFLMSIKTSDFIKKLESKGIKFVNSDSEWTEILIQKLDHPGKTLFHCLDVLKGYDIPVGKKESLLSSLISQFLELQKELRFFRGLIGKVNPRNIGILPTGKLYIINYGNLIILNQEEKANAVVNTEIGSKYLACFGIPEESYRKSEKNPGKLIYNRNVEIINFIHVILFLMTNQYTDGTQATKSWEGFKRRDLESALGTIFQTFLVNCTLKQTDAEFEKTNFFRSSLIEILNSDCYDTSKVDLLEYLPKNYPQLLPSNLDCRCMIHELRSAPSNFYFWLEYFFSRDVDHEDSRFYHVDETRNNLMDHLKEHDDNFEMITSLKETRDTEIIEFYLPISTLFQSAFREITATYRINRNIKDRIHPFHVCPEGEMFLFRKKGNSVCFPRKLLGQAQMGMDRFICPFLKRLEEGSKRTESEVIDIKRTFFKFLYYQLKVILTELRICGISHNQISPQSLLIDQFGNVTLWNFKFSSNKYPHTIKQMGIINKEFINPWTMRDDPMLNCTFISANNDEVCSLLTLLVLLNPGSNFHENLKLFEVDNPSYPSGIKDLGSLDCAIEEAKKWINDKSILEDLETLKLDQKNALPYNISSLLFLEDCEQIEVESKKQIGDIIQKVF